MHENSFHQTEIDNLVIKQIPHDKDLSFEKKKTLEDIKTQEALLKKEILTPVSGPHKSDAYEHYEIDPGNVFKKMFTILLRGDKIVGLFKNKEQKESQKHFLKIIEKAKTIIDQRNKYNTDNNHNTIHESQYNIKDITILIKHINSRIQTTQPPNSHDQKIWEIIKTSIQIETGHIIKQNLRQLSQALENQITLRTSTTQQPAKINTPSQREKRKNDSQYLEAQAQIEKMITQLSLSPMSKLGLRAIWENAGRPPITIKRSALPQYDIQTKTIIIPSDGNNDDHNMIIYGLMHHAYASKDPSGYQEHIDQRNTKRKEGEYIKKAKERNQTHNTHYTTPHAFAIREDQQYLEKTQARELLANIRNEAIDNYVSTTQSSLNRLDSLRLRDEAEINKLPTTYNMPQWPQSRPRDQSSAINWWGDDTQAGFGNGQDGGLDAGEWIEGIDLTKWEVQGCTKPAAHHRFGTYDHLNGNLIAMEVKPYGNRIPLPETTETDTTKQKATAFLRLPADERQKIQTQSTSQIRLSIPDGYIITEMKIGNNSITHVNKSNDGLYTIDANQLSGDVFIGLAPQDKIQNNSPDLGECIQLKEFEKDAIQGWIQQLLDPEDPTLSPNDKKHLQTMIHKADKKQPLTKKEIRDASDAFSRTMVYCNDKKYQYIDTAYRSYRDPITNQSSYLAGAIYHWHQGTYKDLIGGDKKKGDNRIIADCDVANSLWLAFCGTYGIAGRLGIGYAQGKLGIGLHGWSEVFVSDQNKRISLDVTPNDKLSAIENNTKKLQKKKDNDTSEEKRNYETKKAAYTKGLSNYELMIKAYTKTQEYQKWKKQRIEDWEKKRIQNAMIDTFEQQGQTSTIKTYIDYEKEEIKKMQQYLPDKTELPRHIQYEIDQKELGTNPREKMLEPYITTLDMLNNPIIINTILGFNRNTDTTKAYLKQFDKRNNLQCTIDNVTLDIADIPHELYDQCIDATLNNPDKSADEILKSILDKNPNIKSEVLRDKRIAERNKKILLNDHTAIGLAKGIPAGFSCLDYIKRVQNNYQSIYQEYENSVRKGTYTIPPEWSQLLHEYKNEQEKTKQKEQQVIKNITNIMVDTIKKATCYDQNTGEQRSTFDATTQTLYIDNARGDIIEQHIALLPEDQQILALQHKEKCLHNALQSFTDLQEITITNLNTFKGHLTLPPLSKVRKINIYSCINLKACKISDGYTSLQNLSFSNNTKVEHLDIGSTISSIQNIECRINDNLGSIKLPSTMNNCTNIDISENPTLKELSIPNTLVNLQTLKCFRNQLSSLVIPNTLGKLKILNCSDNQLSSLVIRNELGNLEGLNCSQNQLSNLIIPNELVNLKELDCYRNTLPKNVKERLKEREKEKQGRRLIIDN